MPTMIVLNNASESVRHLCQYDKRLSLLIQRIGTVSYKPYPDQYAFLVSTIIGQMLSNKAADVIERRVKELCGGIISIETVSTITDAAFRSSGLSQSKIVYIKTLTNSILNSEIDLNMLANYTDDEVIQRLTTIRGIGQWTAKMYLIFVLNRQDILPYEDGAFLQSYKWLYDTMDTKPSEIKKRCRVWQPYSSIAARYLYKALDNGLTKSIL